MIRKDIYSVKERQGIGYVHVMMTKDRQTAENWKRDCLRMNPFCGAKIVHPSQALLDSFLSVGNTLY